MGLCTTTLMIGERFLINIVMRPMNYGFVYLNNVPDSEGGKV